MSSCLIDVAQFANVLRIHMNDSPDEYTDHILEKAPVNYLENKLFD